MLEVLTYVTSAVFFVAAPCMIVVVMFVEATTDKNFLKKLQKD